MIVKLSHRDRMPLDMVLPFLSIGQRNVRKVHNSKRVNQSNGYIPTDCRVLSSGCK